MHPGKVGIVLTTNKINETTLYVTSVRFQHCFIYIDVRDTRFEVLSVVIGYSC